VTLCVPRHATRRLLQVFQGGNWRHLLDMLETASGDNVLYVGDHMYSDILRSKRSLGWRTCLVIPELAEEVRELQSNRGLDEKWVVGLCRVGVYV
jgi:predicted HAD superfamily phosphohydrolase YqeG